MKSFFRKLCVLMIVLQVLGIGAYFGYAPALKHVKAKYVAWQESKAVAEVEKTKQIDWLKGLCTENRAFLELLGKPMTLLKLTPQQAQASLDSVNNNGIPCVQLAFDIGDGVFVFACLPRDRMRIKLIKDCPSPTINFTVRETNEYDYFGAGKFFYLAQQFACEYDPLTLRQWFTVRPGQMLRHSVACATITCSEQDWPAFLQIQ